MDGGETESEETKQKMNKFDAHTVRFLEKTFSGFKKMGRRSKVLLSFPVSTKRFGLLIFAANS